MNFLEAKKILKNFKGGRSFPLFLGISGTADPLYPFLRAFAASDGYDLHCQNPEFNTLGQYFSGSPHDEICKVFLLFPWDIIPALDWRSSFPKKNVNAEVLQNEAEVVLTTVQRLNPKRIVYINAPVCPVLFDHREQMALGRYLEGRILNLGGEVLSQDYFNLASYLVSGTALSGPNLGTVAECLLAGIFGPPKSTCKILVTDCDNVMWSGVVAEDSVAGISFGPEGKGYKHFIYQSYLKHLKNSGVLLAAVSRNHPDDVDKALAMSDMTLGTDDFIAVFASYEAKSAQIKNLATHLNLGLDSFVFVDDNEIEIEEVQNKLPAVNTILFPDNEHVLPAFFSKLSQLFSNDNVTQEDANRTNLYRLRVETLPPSDDKGGDLTQFLSKLEMKLTFHDRTGGGWERAIQLVNKTNQFSANGHRTDEQQVKSLVQDGGKVLSASLEDKNGSHGEILSCLVDKTGRISHLVMSCRVFQRRIEFAFLDWLLSTQNLEFRLCYQMTNRNQPFQKFLSQLGIDDAEILSSEYMHEVDLNNKALKKICGLSREIITILNGSS